MATPLATGAAALVRQYLRTVKRRANPSAALIKATLLHGAQHRSYRHAPSAAEPSTTLRRGGATWICEACWRRRCRSGQVVRQSQRPEHRPELALVLPR